MRILMEELLAKSKQPGMSIEAAGVSRHLDLAIALAAAEASDPNTPFALLEDLFDANVISAAESLFALVEARAAALAPFLTADAKYQRCKLTLIRSCNELLRRLSKSKNTNFRGRVLMFMAYTFPLGERSGVNLKGATAPSSVEIEAEGDGDEEDMQVDAGAAGAGAESGNGPAQGVVNYGFYATFWGLQKAFADPAKSVVKDAWPGLVERLQTVLEVFGSFSGSDDVAEEWPEDGEGETALLIKPLKLQLRRRRRRCWRRCTSLLHVIEADDAAAARRLLPASRPRPSAHLLADGRNRAQGRAHAIGQPEAAG